MEVCEKCGKFKKPTMKGSDRQSDLKANMKETYYSLQKIKLSDKEAEKLVKEHERCDVKKKCRRLRKLECKTLCKHKKKNCNECDLDKENVEHKKHKKHTTKPKFVQSRQYIESRKPIPMGQSKPHPSRIQSRKPIPMSQVKPHPSRLK